MSHGYRVQIAARPEDTLTQGAARGEIARMDATCFPYDDPPDLTQGYWWIVWHGGEAVAYAGMRLMGWGGAYFCRAGVMPTHRGRRLQTRLLRARCMMARHLEQHAAFTDTTAENRQSANNLIRAGFVLYAPGYRWGETGALYWWKDL